MSDMSMSSPPPPLESESPPLGLRPRLAPALAGASDSAAAALVLGSMYGENYAFEDTTPQSDGLLPRKFSSFMDAAKEAANSRLYGGIHFRAAIERGLDQGRCIGAFAAALKMSH